LEELCRVKKIFFRPGHGMLFFQALKAHRLWREFHPSSRKVRAIFEKFQKQKALFPETLSR
jgi:shikimate 5-dehydrogenase